MPKYPFSRFTHSALLAALSVTSVSTVQAAPTPRSRAPRVREKSPLQVVANFYGAMPTGVTVSQKGRVFVNFPRWGDEVKYSVAEIVNGRAVAFPNRQINNFGDSGTRKLLAQEQSSRAAALRRNHFVSVQSVVVDPLDRLWVLDTGSIEFAPNAPGGPKMVCIDLATNRVVKTIAFSRDAVKPGTYLNDVRFDLTKGSAGTAYITDSSVAALIVVDLASGKAMRRLEKHPTLVVDPKFVPFPEGRAMLATPPGKFPTYIKFQVDGIAISNDGARLFYCPVASRRLYSVSTAALRNPNATDATIARTIVDHGEKGMADGLESDSANRVYITQPETNSISRRFPNTLFETLARDPRLIWPDTLSLGTNGDLYVMVNQLNRQKGYQFGKDLRVKPYTLFKIKTNGAPIRLK